MYNALDMSIAAGRKNGQSNRKKTLVRWIHRMQKKQISNNEYRTAACDEPFGRELRAGRLRVERLSRVELRKVNSLYSVFFK